MSELIYTSEDAGWMDEDGHGDGGFNNYNEFCEYYWRKGFRIWPGHVPAPMDGYDFVFYGPMLWSNPPCSRWHRFIFKLPQRLAWWLNDIFGSHGGNKP